MTDELDALAQAALDPEARPDLAPRVSEAAQAAHAALRALVAVHDEAYARACPDGLSTDLESAPSVPLDLSLLDTATSALRAIRNLCAGCPEAQDAAPSDLFLTLVPLFVAAYGREEDEAAVLGVRVGLQATANWLTGNERNQALLWAAWAPDGLLGCWYALRGQAKAFAVVTRVVYHCCCCSSGEGAGERRAALAGMGGAVCMLLQSTLPPPTSSEDAALEPLDPRFEPAQLLFTELLAQGLLPSLYRATASGSIRLEEEDAARLVTAERLILLRMLLLVASEQSLPAPSLVFLCDVLRQMQLPAPVPPQDLGAADSYDAERGEMWERFREEGLTLVLECFRDQLARIPEAEGEELRAALTGAGLPLLLLDALRAVFPDMTGAPTSSGPDGRGCLVLSTLGNAVFRCRAAQDAVREAEGLPAVLYCCQMDSANPMLREWGVLAVRHLCEGNEENQREIAAMEAQEVAPETAEELQRRGLTAELQGGKLRVARR